MNLSDLFYKKEDLRAISDNQFYMFNNLFITYFLEKIKNLKLK